MPHRALIRIIIATLVGLAIWVPASAASADDGCCSMTLSGLPATFQAGADPVVFSAAISVNEPADPQQAFRYLAAQFDLQAGNNLSGGQLHFAWRPQNSNGNWHSVGFSRHDGLLQATFYPYQNVPNAGQININLRLSFGDHVPATNLQVGMVLMGSARKSDAKELAHAGPFASAVLPEAATPPPTHTAAPPAAVVPSPTASPVETATATPEDTSTSDLGALPAVAPTSNDGSGSGVWIFYIIGGLLLIAGIGVIGTLLWKRSGDATEWPDPNDPSLYGDQNQPYPGQAYPPASYPQPNAYPPATHPTTAYPRHGGRPPTDPTRQMPGL